MNGFAVSNPTVKNKKQPTIIPNQEKRIRVKFLIGNKIHTSIYPKIIVQHI